MLPLPNRLSILAQRFADEKIGAVSSLCISPPTVALLEVLFHDATCCHMTRKASYTSFPREDPIDWNGNNGCNAEIACLHRGPSSPTMSTAIHLSIGHDIPCTTMLPAVATRAPCVLSRKVLVQTSAVTGAHLSTPHHLQALLPGLAEPRQPFIRHAAAQLALRRS